jgi:hypothetical protein
MYCGFFANRSFTAPIAETGMGKTTLLFEFLDHIRDRARTAFLFSNLCNPHGILSSILRDLGVPPGRTTSDLHWQLNELLTLRREAADALRW